MRFARTSSQTTRAPRTARHAPTSGAATASRAQISARLDRAIFSEASVARQPRLRLRALSARPGAVAVCRARPALEHLVFLATRQVLAQASRAEPQASRAEPQASPEALSASRFFLASTVFLASRFSLASTFFRAGSIRRLRRTL